MSENPGFKPEKESQDNTDHSERREFTSHVKGLVGRLIEQNPDIMDQLRINEESYDYDNFWFELAAQHDRLFQEQQETFESQQEADERLIPSSLRFTTELMELRQRVEEADREKYTDALTKVLNQDYFEERFPAVIEEALRSGKESVMISLDIDSFKEINDIYGHEAGDHILSKLGFILQRNLREGDKIVRRGGDEFVLFIERVDPEQGVSVAERIRADAEDNLIDEKTQAEATISLGVAEANPSNIQEAPRDIINNADTALYNSKRKKDPKTNEIVDIKNSVTLYREGMTMSDYEQQ